MKRNRTAIVLVALVSVAAVLFGLRLHGQDEEKATPLVVSAAKTTPGGAAAISATQPVPPASIANPYAVARAADLLQPGRFPPELIPDHEQMLMRSIAACAPVAPELQLEMEKKLKSMIQAEKRSVLIYQAFIRRYCNGFSGEQAQALLSTVFEKRLPMHEELALESTIRKMLESKIPGDLSQVDKATADTLNQSLVSTNSPQIFEQSAFFLLRTQHVPETYMAGLDSSIRARARNNTAIIHNAVASARCQIFGGCGADSLLAMQSCFPHNCRFDTKYGDNSGLTLTPAEREIATLIAQRLIAARR